MTQTVKRFWKNASVVVASSVLMRTVAVVFSASVSKKIGAQGMGLYTLVMSVYGFAVTLATSGVHLAVTRTVSETLGCGDESSARKYMKTAFAFACFFGTLSSAVLLMLAGPIGKGLLGDIRTVPSLRLLGFSMLPIALSTAMNGYFLARKRVSRNAASQIFEQFTRITLISLFLILLLPRGVEYACIAMVGGGALAEILSFLFLGAEYIIDVRHIGSRKADKADFLHLKTILGIAMPVAASAYIRSGLLTVEHSLIPTSIEKSGRTKEQSLSDYGVLHGMAMPIVLYPTAILFPVAGLLVPEFAARKARGEYRSMRSLCGRALEGCVSFGLWCALLLSVFSTELGVIIYKSWDVGKYIFLLSFVVPIMFADNTVDCMLKGIGEQVWSMWVNIIDSCLSIILVIALLPKMGAAGYLWVIILAEIFNFSFSFGRLANRLKYRVSLWNVLFRPLICTLCAAFATIVFLPMDSASSSLVWMILRMVFSSCIYIALLTLVKACGTKKHRADIPLSKQTASKGSIT